MIIGRNDIMMKSLEKDLLHAILMLKGFITILRLSGSSYFLASKIKRRITWLQSQTISLTLI